MTAHDKAQQGLSLLKEAFLDYLATQSQDGASGCEIREALGINDSDSDGGHKVYVLWGLLNLIAEDGKIQRRKAGRVYRFFLR